MKLDDFNYLDDAQKRAVMGAINDGRIDVSKWSGKVSGKLDGLTREEWAALDMYLSEGKNVFRIPEGKDKAADFLIDNLKVEFKGLEIDGYKSVRKKTLQYATESFQTLPLGKDADTLVIDCISNNQMIGKTEALKIVEEVKNIYPDKFIEIWTREGKVLK